MPGCRVRSLTLATTLAAAITYNKAMAARREHLPRNLRVPRLVGLGEATISGLWSGETQAGMHVIVWLPRLTYAKFACLIELGLARGLGLHPVHPYYRIAPPYPGLLVGFAGLSCNQIRAAVTIQPPMKPSQVLLGLTTGAIFNVTVVDPATVVATHLNQVIQTAAADLFGMDEAQKLIDALEDDDRDLALGALLIVVVRGPLSGHRPPELWLLFWSGVTGVGREREGHGVGQPGREREPVFERPHGHDAVDHEGGDDVDVLLLLDDHLLLRDGELADDAVGELAGAVIPGGVTLPPRHGEDPAEDRSEHPSDDLPPHARPLPGGRRRRLVLEGPDRGLAGGVIEATIARVRAIGTGAVRMAGPSSLSSWTIGSITAAAMSTTAVLSPDGRHYILNGEKWFVTSGDVATVIVVMANLLDGDAERDGAAPLVPPPAVVGGGRPPRSVGKSRWCWCR